MDGYILNTSESMGSLDKSDGSTGGYTWATLTAPVEKTPTCDVSDHNN